MSSSFRITEKKYRRQYSRNFPDTPFPNLKENKSLDNVTNNILNLFEEITRERNAITKSEQYVFGTRLLSSPSKSLLRVAKQTDMSESLASNATKCSNCVSCSSELYSTIHETKLNFLNWYFHNVYDRELDLHTWSV
jgi:hypothetical protein